MKKLLVLCLIFLFGSCTSGTIVSPSGTKVEFSRPIFANLNISWTESTGVVSTGSSVQLDQIMALAIQGYAKYVSGGVMSTPPVPTSQPTIGPLITGGTE
jgi:hypothetical protein